MVNQSTFGIALALSLRHACATVGLIAIIACVVPRSLSWGADPQRPEARHLDPQQPKTGRPNILWIVSEDNSKHYLRHFDRHGAVAPSIEALAGHGVTFDRAFSCGPVCSVARTTLITSCYAPRVGTQFHRRSKLAAMPDGLKMFPAYLRAAGYYTTNNSKEDYNAAKSTDVWDDSSNKASWKNRPSDSTPFFHVLTSGLSHESSLHFDAVAMEQPTVTDTESVQLQPYFPDTPIFRYTRARYHDRILAIDQVVRKTVMELEEAGELENTFVFYFGDHGGVLPRSKGYAYESGLHVPLIVRVPENFSDLAGRELASRSSGFVEFVDFGPTVLALAGLDPPQGIDGKAFLGQGVDPAEVDSRDEAFGYAERKLSKALDSDDPWTRYWALVACSSFGKEAASLLPLAEKRLLDLEPLVVMRAVEFVAIAGDTDPRRFLYRSLERATNEPEALRILNTAVFLNDFSDQRLPIDTGKLEMLFEPKPRSEIVRRLDYLAR